MRQNLHTTMASIQKNIDREGWSAEEYTTWCGSEMDKADLKVNFHSRLYIQVLCHGWKTGMYEESMSTWIPQYKNLTESDYFNATNFSTIIDYFQLFKFFLTFSQLKNLLF